MRDTPGDDGAGDCVSHLRAGKDAPRPFRHGQRVAVPVLRAILRPGRLALFGVSRRAWRAVSVVRHRGNVVDTTAVSRCGKKAGVFEAANIREWRGHDVVDAEGHKIGELEAVYVDTATDLPSFGTVKVGIPTRHRLVFVPLDQATVGPGYVKVSYDKKQVKDAPSIGTDGELPAGDEEAIFKHYGLTYEPGAGGERRLARR